MLPPVYVLIGGESQRFGACKATWEVDGEPWALHVGRRLAESDDQITLVGELAFPGPLAGVRRIEDSRLCGGPLAGVLAALADRGDGLLTVASCDLVRPEPSWLAPLLKHFSTGEGIEAAAYWADDRWQPFPLVAHSRWLAELARLTETGSRSMRDALEGSCVSSEPWPLDDTRRLTANTPGELAAALVRAEE